MDLTIPLLAVLEKADHTIHLKKRLKIDPIILLRHQLTLGLTTLLEYQLKLDHPLKDPLCHHPLTSQDPHNLVDPQRDQLKYLQGDLDLMVDLLMIIKNCQQDLQDHHL